MGKEVEHNRKEEKGDKHFSLRPALESVDNFLHEAEKKSPFYKPVESFAGEGIRRLDLSSEPPHEVNKLVKNLDPDSYNCKFYVKAFIDGKLPGKGRQEELSDSDLTNRGYKLQASAAYLKPGDIVLVLPEKGTATFSSVVHAAIVTRVDKGQPAVLVQKPDGVGHVSESTLDAMGRHYGVTSGKCRLAIYRKEAKS